MANVALADIGKTFDAGQTALNLVAVGYSLGLAASVVYLGALGDARAQADAHPRHGARDPHQDQIVAAAKSSFLQGDEWAYITGIVASLLGAALIFFLFPTKDREEQLLARYHAEDVPEAAKPPAPVAPALR